MDLFTTSFADRGKGHGAALMRAVEQFLGAKARVKQLLAVASAQEKEMVGVMQKKFGFSKLNGRQTRVLRSEFPALQVGWGGGQWAVGGACLCVYVHVHVGLSALGRLCACMVLRCSFSGKNVIRAAN